MNLQEKKGDRIHRNIDIFLLALVAEDKDNFSQIKEKYGLEEGGSMQSEAQQFNEIGLFEDISEESFSDGIDSKQEGQ